MNKVIARSSGISVRGKGGLRAWVFVLAAGFSGLSMADPAAIQRCRQESDSLARLRCYDAIPLPATATGAAAAGQAAAPAPGQASGPSVQARSVPAPAPVTPADPAAQFGLENRTTAQQAKPDAIESVIPGRFDGWVRGSRFRLANGQIWEIRDNSQGTYALQDPKVRITRGISGSFFMEVAGVSQTPRVRRVE